VEETNMRKLQCKHHPVDHKVYLDSGNIRGEKVFLAMGWTKEATFEMSLDKQVVLEVYIKKKQTIKYINKKRINSQLSDVV